MKINKLGERLKDIRLEKGLDQKTLAISLNTSQTNVSRWENGKFEPDLDTLIKIARFFNVSTDYILGLTDF